VANDLQRRREDCFGGLDLAKSIDAHCALPMFRQSIQACSASQLGSNRRTSGDISSIDFMNINRQYLSLVKYY